MLLPVLLLAVLLLPVFFIVLLLIVLFRGRIDLHHYRCLRARLPLVGDDGRDGGGSGILGDSAQMAIRVESYARWQGAVAGAPHQRRRTARHRQGLIHRLARLQTHGFAGGNEWPWIHRQTQGYLARTAISGFDGRWP